MNDSFLSIVSDRDSPDRLLVRARFKHDIEKVFGTGYPVTESPVWDYRYRASIPRAVVGRKLAERISRIDYDNFKNSVAEESRHDAYMEVWMTMSRHTRLNEF